MASEAILAPSCARSDLICPITPFAGLPGGGRRCVSLAAREGHPCCLFSEHPGMQQQAFRNVCTHHPGFCRGVVSLRFRLLNRHAVCCLKRAWCVMTVEGAHACAGPRFDWLVCPRKRAFHRERTQGQSSVEARRQRSARLVGFVCSRLGMDWRHGNWSQFWRGDQLTAGARNRQTPSCRCPALSGGFVLMHPSLSASMRASSAPAVPKAQEQTGAHGAQALCEARRPDPRIVLRRSCSLGWGSPH